VTEKIDLVFKVECRLCGTQTEFDLSRIDPEDPLRCPGCNHPFSVSHQLALSLRNRIATFIGSIPEESEE